LRQVLDQPIDVKLHLLLDYAEMARLLATETMNEEVEMLTGTRYSRKESSQRNRRWGSSPGSIRIDSERVPVDGPRVRDVEAGKEHPLRRYQAMKEDPRSEEVAEAILLGLAQDDNE